MFIQKIQSLNHRVYPQHNFFSPKWIVLGVNNICNLHCKMCDVGTESLNTTFAQNLVGTTPLNMPLELIKDIINQTAIYFPKAKIGYAFTEPLIYPHLIESLAYANTHGLYTTVTTNALTLKQKAQQLVDAGLNELFVSLDGTQDIHNEIRGNKKSFQKAIEGIELISSLKNSPKITLIYALTEWNIDCMIDFLDYFKTKNIYKVGFMHTQFTDEHIAEIHNIKYGDLYKATISNIQELDFSKLDLNKLLANINYIKKTTYPFKVFFSPEIASSEGLDSYYNHPERLLGRYCHDVFNNIMVKSDGSVIPSHGRCYNLTVGNIYQNNLKQIWNSATFNKFRTDIMQAGGYFDACSRCCSAFNGYGKKK
ncbi:radical SAM/SPASM domain-containing protein [Spirosoma gilvum]